MLDPKSFLKRKRVILTLSVALVGLALTATILSTSLNVGSPESGAITKEEAIEISRNTTTVQSALEDAARLGYFEFQPNANHWNATFIKSLKQDYSNATEFENLPEDHGVWRIFWNIMPPGYLILHFIDELTGQILFEDTFYAG